MNYQTLLNEANLAADARDAAWDDLQSSAVEDQADATSRWVEAKQAAEAAQDAFERSLVTP